MKLIRPAFYFSVILLSLNACKAKKLVQKPTPMAETPTPPPPPPTQPKTQLSAETSAPLPPAPVADYNFSNIQFEYNSGILKTASYPLLDKVATNMKIDPSAKFMLNGFASAEGTADHNMQLSVDRANAVKAYLVNSGVSATVLGTKGYGESNPMADNTTEEGRILNRRVEIKKVN